MTDRFYEQKTVRYHQISRQYRRLIAIMAIVIIILFILLLTSRATRVHADERVQVTYESVCVYSGDTLWSIAEDHKPDTMTVKAYMEKIKAINHLSDSFLVSGEYLILPVYSYPD